MAFKQYNQPKSLELIAAEEYQQDMSVMRFLIGNHASPEDIQICARWLLAKYNRAFIKGSEHEKEIEVIRKKARETGNQIAYAMDIIEVISGCSIDAGFWGKINVGTDKPKKNNL